jgi:hypothetical protein
MQEKADANTKTMREDMETNQAKADANLETMLAEIKADRKEYREELKEMRPIIKSRSGDLQADREDGEEIVACQEKAEARLEVEEPASEEMKPEVADKEVPVEDAVMPVGHFSTI